MGMNQAEVLRLMLSKESVLELREKLINLLARSTMKMHIGSIEAIAIKDIFEVGMKEIGVELKEIGVEPK